MDTLETHIKHSFYTSEELLFFHWKLLNQTTPIKKFPRPFTLPLPSSWQESDLKAIILSYWQNELVSLKNINFEKPDTNKPPSNEISRFEKFLEKHSEKEEIKAIKKLLSNQFTTSDLKLITEALIPKSDSQLTKGVGSIFKSQYLKGVQFDIEKSKNQQEHLQKQLEDYLKKFKNQDLSGKALTITENTLSPSKHKKTLIKRIHKYHENYGDNFTLHSSSFNQDEFLFVHGLLLFAEEDNGFIFQLKATHPSINPKDNYIAKLKIQNPNKLRVNLQDEKIIINSDKNELVLNTDTGLIKLNEKEVSISPTKNEFTFLMLLATGDNYKRTYEELIKGIWSHKEDNKTNRDHLRSNVLHGLKSKLGIINGQNPDIFKSIRNEGYRLDI